MGGNIRLRRAYINNQFKSQLDIAQGAQTHKSSMAKLSNTQRPERPRKITLPSLIMLSGLLLTLQAMAQTCSDPATTPSEVTDKTYTVGSPFGSFLMPEFTPASPECTLTYIVDSGESDFIFEQVSTSPGREVAWQTDDNANIGTYPVTITAEDVLTGTIVGSVTYNVIIVPDCSQQAMNITPPTVVDQFYTVNGAEASYEVPEFGSDAPFCTLTYTVDFDSSQVWLSPDPINGRLMTWQTSDNANSGTYMIRVTAMGPEPDLVSWTVAYELTVSVDCSTQTITPSVAVDQNYKIGDPTASYQVPAFGNTDEINCPLTYDWVRDIELTSWTYFDVEPRTLVWMSLTNTKSGTFKITVTAENPAGLTAETSYLLRVDPDCNDQVVTGPAVVKQFYTVGDVAGSYRVPDFDNSDDLYCPLTYELIYKFDQLWLTEIDGQTIQWQTNDNKNTGKYGIEVKATGPDGKHDTVKYELEVLVGCFTQVISLPVNPIVDQTYTVNDGNKQYEVDKFTNDQDGFCPLTYSVSFDPALTWMIPLTNEKGTKWNVEDNSAVGTYTVTVTATGPDGVSFAASFDLTVLPDCSNQVLTPSLVPDEAYKAKTPQVLYSAPTFGNSDPTYCPLTYTYTYDASLTWIVDPGDGTLGWQTDDNADIGSYPITIVATGPEGASETASFTLTVQVNCAFQVLQVPTDLVARVESIVTTGPDSYEVSEFTNDETLYCPITYSTTFVPSPTWMSVLSSQRGVLWQADLATDIGTYTVTVTATGPEAVQLSASFDVDVVFSCVIQQLSAPTVVDQTYKVATGGGSYEVPEFTNDWPVECPLTYTLSYDTSQLWLSELSDRSLQWTSTQNAHVGAYSVTLTAEGPTGVSESVTYTLTLTPNCLTQVITPPVVPLQTYTAYDAQASTQIDPFGNSQETHCPLTYTFSYTVSFVTENAADREIQYFTEENEDSGDHTITVTATGPEGVTASTDFTLRVQPTCQFKTVTLPFTLDQYYTVNSAANSYLVDLFFNSEPVYCPLAYELVYDTSQAWMFPLSDRELGWETFTNTDRGEYTVTVRATCPEGLTYEASYLLTVFPDCSGIVITNPEVEDQVYVVNDPTASYTVPEFGNSDPTYCPLSYYAVYDEMLLWVSDLDRVVQWQTGDDGAKGVYQITMVAYSAGYGASIEDQIELADLRQLYVPDQLPTSEEKISTPIDEGSDSARIAPLSRSVGRAVGGVEGRKLQEVSSQVNFFLEVKLQCLDALMIFKVTSVPRIGSYTLEDAPLVYAFEDDDVFTDQTSVQCPNDILMDITFVDGTPLDQDVWSWDAPTQTFTVVTADYERYVQDTLHEFRLTAYYEGFPPESGDTIDFLIELIIDCNRIPYEEPVIDEFVYIVDQMDPVFSIELEPTFCGPWVYLDSEISYKKSFAWCQWCYYTNNGLFDWDLVSYQVTLTDVDSSDTGSYEISLPVQIPGSNVIVQIPIMISIAYCGIDDLVATPVSDEPLVYTIFEPELQITAAEYVQVPSCDYELIYRWRFIDPETQAYMALPGIFTTADRLLTVQTDDLAQAGTYSFVFKGSVSLLYLFPEVYTEMPTTLEIVNPCVTTEVDSDGAYRMSDRLVVPIGQVEYTYRYVLPTDSVSLLYGTGRDKCGERSVKVTTNEGLPIDDENISYRTLPGDRIELNVQSFPDEGELIRKYLKLTVSMAEYYSTVTPVDYYFTVEYRKEIPPEPIVPIIPEEPRNKTESGFEVFPFEPDVSVDPIQITGNKSIAITIPAITNALGVASPLYLELPEKVAEFAFYDQNARTIFVDGTKITYEHVGTYDLVVEVGYGFSTMEKRISLPTQIIVCCIDPPPAPPAPLVEPEEPKLPEIPVQTLEDLEKMVPDFDITVFTQPYEPGKFSVFGQEIPQDQVKSLSEFSLRDSLDPAPYTGSEPVPSIRAVDESGTLTIDWDKQMRKPLDLGLLQTQTYAVLDSDPLTTQENERRRRLVRRREWFNTDEQFLKYLLVVEALEIDIVAELGDGETFQVPFTWDLSVFGDFDLQIQLYFYAEDLQVERNQRNNISVTFWGTEFFKSLDDKSVRYGERIESVIRWNALIKPSEVAGSLSEATFVANLVTIGSLIAAPILLFLQRSLLQLWLLMVTLQVISHLPLLNSMMPAEALVFLRQILSMTRLFYTNSQESTTPLNSVFEQAGYLGSDLGPNLSTLHRVLLPVCVVTATVFVTVDYLAYRRGSLRPPKCVQATISAVASFTVFFFAYCLLELNLCALIVIKSDNSATLPAIMTLALTAAPFIYTSTFFWRFKAKYSAPDFVTPPLSLEQKPSQPLQSKDLTPIKEQEEDFYREVELKVSSSGLSGSQSRQEAGSQSPSGQGGTSGQGASSGLEFRVVDPQGIQEESRMYDSRVGMLQATDSLIESMPQEMGQPQPQSRTASGQSALEGQSQKADSQAYFVSGGVTPMEGAQVNHAIELEETGKVEVQDERQSVQSAKSQVQPKSEGSQSLSDKFRQHDSNEPMPEPVISCASPTREINNLTQDARGEDIAAQADEPACFEGGQLIHTPKNIDKAHLRAQARLKVYHHDGLRQASQGLTQSIYGRGLSKDALAFNIAFAARAFTLALAFVMGNDWAFPLQIWLCFAAQTLYMCQAFQAGKNALWESTTLRYQFYLNELAIAWAIGLQLWFSEHVDSLAQRTQIGHSFITFVIIVVILNFAFILYDIGIAVKSKIDQIRARRQRQQALLHMQSATENPFLGPQNSTTQGNNLGEWLDGPLQNRNNQDWMEGELLQGLHLKNKSSKVAPVPVLEENYNDREGSGSSNWLGDYHSQPSQANENIPLDYPLGQSENEQPLEEQKIVNIDDLCEDLDVDVNLEAIAQETGEDLRCHKDDSQDVPIKISSRLSRDFGKSQASNAAVSDQFKSLLGHDCSNNDPGFDAGIGIGLLDRYLSTADQGTRMQDTTDVNLEANQTKTALMDSSQERDPDLITPPPIPSYEMKDAMEIADELEILPEGTTDQRIGEDENKAQSEGLASDSQPGVENIDDDFSNPSIGEQPPSRSQQASKQSFMRKLDDFEKSLEDEDRKSKEEVDGPLDISASPKHEAAAAVEGNQGEDTVSLNLTKLQGSSDKAKESGDLSNFEGLPDIALNGRRGTFRKGADISPAENKHILDELDDLNNLSSLKESVPRDPLEATKPEEEPEPIIPKKQRMASKWAGAGRKSFAAPPLIAPKTTTKKDTQPASKQQPKLAKSKTKVASDSITSIKKAQKSVAAVRAKQAQANAEMRDELTQRFGISEAPSSQAKPKKKVAGGKKLLKAKSLRKAGKLGDRQDSTEESDLDSDTEVQHPLTYRNENRAGNDLQEAFGSGAQARGNDFAGNKKGLSLRNRSQGELIMEQSPKRMAKGAMGFENGGGFMPKLHKLDSVGALYGGLGETEQKNMTSQANLSLKLMQFNDPRNSAHEMSVFKDSSIAFNSQGEVEVASQDENALFSRIGNENQDFIAAQSQQQYRQLDQLPHDHQPALEQDDLMNIGSGEGDIGGDLSAEEGVLPSAGQPQLPNDFLASPNDRSAKKPPRHATKSLWYAAGEGGGERSSQANNQSENASGSGLNTFRSKADSLARSQ